MRWRYLNYRLLPGIARMELQLDVLQQVKRLLQEALDQGERRVRVAERKVEIVTGKFVKQIAATLKPSEIRALVECCPEV